MIDFPLTVIWRHRKERLAKCSLRGLEGREDLRFFRYPEELPSGISGYILLEVGAPPLDAREGNRGLLLLDGTWRYAAAMRKALPEVESLLPRSLPLFYHTAYPRRQKGCGDPVGGLASVEALYLAYRLLGRSIEGLLKHYHWREAFLAFNGLK